MPKVADEFRFSTKQEIAIMELLNPVNRTLTDTAKKAGISERTLRYWQNLPQFQNRLQQERKKLQKQGLDILKANFSLATTTLGTLLTDKSPVVRLRASQAIVDYNLKLLEQERGKQPQNPYDEYYDGNPDAPSQVVSIYERLNRLKVLTKSHLEKMREEWDKKQMEKSGGDEIKLEDP